ncbi:Calmodulin-binding protein 60 B [Camellia lanceoleosa]|uniref:Calmodulin-binding protein 60 B n=1 Tax=Camellia lanceoleosa TaxID=1840588 RepID=A0ACC0G752_9ERIC|nr:Calmodulin-binding protein 60 B [Camellia lanceoleosa]
MIHENLNLDAPIQFDGTSFPLHNQMINALQQTQPPRSSSALALGPPQSPMSGFQTGGMSNFTSYRGFEDYFPEEEIRMRSHEMLENEDMQHLLRVFNMGGHGHAPVNVSDDSYPYLSAPHMPSFSIGVS